MQYHISFYSNSALNINVARIYLLPFFDSVTVFSRSILQPHFLVRYPDSFIGPTWGPPGSCRPQMGPMLAQWPLLSTRLAPSCLLLLTDLNHGLYPRITSLISEQSYGRLTASKSNRNDINKYRTSQEYVRNYGITPTKHSLYSLSGRTSYRKISWSLEPAGMDVMMIVSL